MVESGLLWCGILRKIVKVLEMDWYGIAEGLALIPAPDLFIFYLYGF